MLCFISCMYAQDNTRFFNKPFSIFNNAGQVIIAGDVSTYVYNNYYGKNVKAETYTDAHAKPEYLVYELFKQMKNKDINAIGRLYDTTFDKKQFNGNRMVDSLKGYTDIKFISKFNSGDFFIIRYDFVSATKSYAYFALVRNVRGKYFLSMNINVSDPFNLIGSYSPNNLFDRPDETISTKGLTPFYFVKKEGKVFYTPELPGESYTSLYLAFEFFNNNSNTAETEFLKQLQNAGQSGDTMKLKNMIAVSDLPLLSDSYFGNFYYADLKKILKNYPDLTPLATLKINEGKVLYFRYANQLNSFVSSIILKQVNGKYYLGLRITNDDINNILQNVYIRETLVNYFKGR